MVTDPLERLRRLCLALPKTTERLSHGEPTWFVRGRKTFVMYADHHHDDRLAFWCAAPPGVQEELVASDPGRFFVPPYVVHRGWLGVWLDVPVDWDEIEELVTGRLPSDRTQDTGRATGRAERGIIPPLPRLSPAVRGCPRRSFTDDRWCGELGVTEGVLGLDQVGVGGAGWLTGRGPRPDDT